MKLIRKLEADIDSAASVCPADAEVIRSSLVIIEQKNLKNAMKSWNQMRVIQKLHRFIREKSVLIQRINCFVIWRM